MFSEHFFVQTFPIDMLFYCMLLSSGELVYYPVCETKLIPVYCSILPGLQEAVSSNDECKFSAHPYAT